MGLRHADFTTCAALSSDDETIATGGSDGTVRIWDVFTGRPLRIISGHGVGIRSLAFSPDGKYLAIGSDRLNLYKSPYVEPPTVVSLRTATVYSLTFSRSSALLAWGDEDGKVLLWDLSLNAVRGGLTVQGRPSHVTDVAISPDESQLVFTRSNGGLFAWNLKTMAEGPNLTEHNGSISSISFINATTVVFAGRAGVRHWQLGSSVLPNPKTPSRYSHRKLHSPEGSVSAIEHDHINKIRQSVDGRLLATLGNNSAIHIWDIELGRLHAVLAVPPYSGVRDVAFSSDGSKIITANGRSGAMLWETSTKRVLREFRPHTGSDIAVVFSDDNKFVAAAGMQGVVDVWNVETKTLHFRQQAHDGCVHAIAFSNDLRMLITAGDDRIRLWELSSGQLLRQLKGPSERVIGIAVSSDSQQLASYEWDKTIRLWNTADGTEITRLNAGSAGAVMSFSQDGRTLAAGGMSEIRVWNLGNPENPVVLNAHEGWILALRFSADSSVLVSAGSEGRVHVWNAATWRIDLSRSSINLDFPFGDGKGVPARDPNDRTIYFRSTTSGTLVQVPEGSGPRLDAIALSSDLTSIATARSSEIRIWDSTGELIHILEGHLGTVDALTISPNGERLASVGSDNTMRLWDLSNGTLVLTRLKSATGFALFEFGSVIAAEGEVWREYGWQEDGVDGRGEILPAETFDQTFS